MTAPTRARLVRITPGNRIGYAALALAILALITSPLLAGLLFGSLAVTLGIAGLDAVADRAATNRKSTVAAVVLGLIAIVLSLIALGFRIWMIA
jgi:hypothetical protein